MQETYGQEGAACAVAPCRGVRAGTAGLAATPTPAASRPLPVRLRSASLSLAFDQRTVQGFAGDVDRDGATPPTRAE